MAVTIRSGPIIGPRKQLADLQHRHFVVLEAPRYKMTTNFLKPSPVGGLLPRRQRLVPGTKLQLLHHQPVRGLTARFGTGPSATSIIRK